MADSVTHGTRSVRRNSTKETHCIYLVQHITEEIITILHRPNIKETRCKNHMNTIKLTSCHRSLVVQINEILSIVTI